MYALFLLFASCAFLIVRLMLNGERDRWRIQQFADELETRVEQRTRDLRRLAAELDAAESRERRQLARPATISADAGGGAHPPRRAEQLGRGAGARGRGARRRADRAPTARRARWPCSWHRPCSTTSGCLRRSRVAGRGDRAQLRAEGLGGGRRPAQGSVAGGALHPLPRHARAADQCRQACAGRVGRGGDRARRRQHRVRVRDCGVGFDPQVLAAAKARGWAC